MRESDYFYFCAALMMMNVKLRGTGMIISVNIPVSVIKEIQIIFRLFLVIAMYCQASSSQMKSITQPPTLLAGWEGSLGTCSK